MLLIFALVKYFSFMQEITVLLQRITTAAKDEEDTADTDGPSVGLLFVVTGVCGRDRRRSLSVSRRNQRRGGRG